MRITTIEKLLAMLKLLAENLPQYKTVLGATEDEILQATEDHDNLQAIKNHSELADAVKMAMNETKNDVFNGEPNAPLSEAAKLADFVAPFPPLKPGCLTRYNKLVKKFKAADGYTREIGILCGIDEPANSGISPGNLMAAAILANLGNYDCEGKFKKQGQSGMTFQWRIKGTEKWSSDINALQSPFVFKITAPAVEGASVEIEVRCRLLKGNSQVGQWSPIYLVTISA